MNKNITIGVSVLAIFLAVFLLLSFVGEKPSRDGVTLDGVEDLVAELLYTDEPTPEEENFLLIGDDDVGAVADGFDAEDFGGHGGHSAVSPPPASETGVAPEDVDAMMLFLFQDGEQTAEAEDETVSENGDDLEEAFAY